MTPSQLKQIFGENVTVISSYASIFNISPIRNKIVVNTRFEKLNHKDMVAALLKYTKNPNGKCPVCGREKCPIFLKALEDLNRLQKNEDVLKNIMHKHMMKNDDPIASASNLKNHFNQLEKKIALELGQLGIEYTKEVQQQAFINFVNASKYLTIPNKHLPKGLDGFAPSKRDIPLKEYSEQERIRLAILGFNDVESRIRVGASHSNIVEINDLFMSYNFAEGLGGNLSGTVHGYMKLDNNRLLVNLALNSPNKQALKDSNFYPSELRVYHKDHLILTKNIRVNPDNPHISPIGYKDIGEAVVIIPEHYRSQEIKVVADLKFHYNSGVGFSPDFWAKDIERKITFQ